MRMFAALSEIAPLGPAERVTFSGTVIDPSGLMTSNAPKPFLPSNFDDKITEAVRLLGKSADPSPTREKLGVVA